MLGTPRLLAWCEAATCAAIDPTLAAGSTSVGTRVELEHLAASAVGQRSRSPPPRRTSTAGCTASPSPPGTPVDGAEKVVATGEMTRVVVDPERFLCRL